MNVAVNAPASVTNTATVAGGGETNTANNSSSDVTTVNPAHRGPTAVAGSDKSVSQGVQLCFDGSGSIPGDSPITTYSWSFGDSTGATGVAPCHTYNTVGSYPVTLTVTDSFGASNSAGLTVTVTNVAPTVYAGPNQVVVVGSSVAFSGNYSDPGAVPKPTPSVGTSATAHRR